MKAVIILVFGSLMYICGLVVGLSDCDHVETQIREVRIKRTTRGKIGEIEVKDLDLDGKYSLYKSK